MRDVIEVQVDEKLYRHFLIDFTRSSIAVLSVDNHFHVVIYKKHSHLYTLKYFLYADKIIGFYECCSLKKMVSYVRELLEVKRK